MLTIMRNASEESILVAFHDVYFKLYSRSGLFFNDHCIFWCDARARCIRLPICESAKSIRIHCNEYIAINAHHVVSLMNAVCVHGYHVLLLRTPTAYKWYMVSDSEIDDLIHRLNALIY